MSTLSLAKNRYIFSSKRTQHIKAKYFFICHYHRSGKVDLQYCPTEEMWADIITKPFQGSKFRFMRGFLMNCLPDYSEDAVFILKPVLQPLPVNLPMKPQISKIAASPRECVVIQLHNTQVLSPSCKQILVPPAPNLKKGCWGDTLFPSHQLSTGAESLSILPMAE
jgi:hypothetical protein